MPSIIERITKKDHIFFLSKIENTFILASSCERSQNRITLLCLTVDMSTNIHKNWSYGSKVFDSFTDRETIVVEKSVVFYLKIKNIDLKFFLWIGPEFCGSSLIFFLKISLAVLDISESKFQAGNAGLCAKWQVPVSAGGSQLLSVRRVGGHVSVGCSEFGGQASFDKWRAACVQWE